MMSASSKISWLIQRLNARSVSRVLRRWGEMRRRARGYDRLSRRFYELGPAAPAHDGATLIADAMWLNPNHILRLRMVISALSQDQPLKLLGVLRRRHDKTHKTMLKSIGFTDFLYLEEDEINYETFLPAAQKILSNVKSHKDILNIKLPSEIPAYIYYDTVLKITEHPQPDIENDIWLNTLAELLRDIEIYKREFSKRSISFVVLSHAVKNEYVSLLWEAVSRRVPVCHMTNFGDATRIRRYVERKDLATPIEHLPYERFKCLAPDVQSRLSDFGDYALTRRTGGLLTELGASLAFRPDQRVDDLATARAALVGSDHRPIIAIFSHIWYDFPHYLNMRNFTDFKDWIEVTLDRISGLRKYTWLLKPHPGESCYTGIGLKDFAHNLSDHIKIISDEVDTKTVINSVDAVVTVHGTVGMEAAWLGKRVLVADNSYYSDWGFVQTSPSREEYVRKLGVICDAPPPDPHQRRLAAACFALSVAEPPEAAAGMRFTCDSGGSALFADIDRHLDDAVGMEKETEQMAEFFAQNEIDSFGAWRAIKVAQSACIKTVS